MRIQVRSGRALAGRPVGTALAWLCAVATSVAVVIVTPPAHAATFAGYEVSFQGASSRNWRILPTGEQVLTPSALAPRTSPSIAGSSNGGFMQTFVASDGTLWVDNNGNGHQVKLSGSAVAVASGTSPAIATGHTDLGDYWDVVWNAPNGRIFVLRSTFEGAAESLGTIRAGTSPAIAHTRDVFVATWVDPNGNLRWLSNLAGPNTRGGISSFKVWPGTSPTVAMDSNFNWKIAVQADTSRLWTVAGVWGGSNTAGYSINVVQTLSAMSSTSPSITVMPTGGYGIAFVASSGRLWYQDDVSGHEIAGPVIPDSSPSIAADGSGGWKIAFLDAVTRTAKTVDSAGRIANTNRLMAAQTNPSITALTK